MKTGNNMNTQNPSLNNPNAKQDELFKTILYLVAYIALFSATVLLFKQASEHPLIPKSDPTPVCVDLIGDKCNKWQ